MIHSILMSPAALDTLLDLAIAVVAVVGGVGIVLGAYWVNGRWRK